MGSADPNRFAATDILAVEALSVGVPLYSAAKLIYTEAEDWVLANSRLVGSWSPSPGFFGV